MGHEKFISFGDAVVDINHAGNPLRKAGQKVAYDYAIPNFGGAATNLYLQFTTVYSDTCAHVAIEACSCNCTLYGSPVLRSELFDPTKHLVPYKLPNFE